MLPFSWLRSAQVVLQGIYPFLLLLFFIFILISGLIWFSVYFFLHEFEMLHWLIGVHREKNKLEGT